MLVHTTPLEAMVPNSIYCYPVASNRLQTGMSRFLSQSAQCTGVENELQRSARAYIPAQTFNSH